ncbi:ABC transporter permease [Roseateles oligotrophus]|uniref:ABC transporter permease n=1 Tax=Roseateles oligotrophus TaxID=1769250 RepID=A0ABT2YMQ0_9BURK|nr:ABC transporter permease [Roseateles oligotrophus]MCV2371347.1 ABC transporter permease [Roseateles oligotrophus]
MRALDRKLLRDLRLLWSQALTIGLVVASAVGGFITSLSAVDSLAVARDEFYAEAHFADLFVDLKRAPLALQQQLQELPGVLAVQTTLEQMVRVEIAGLPDPIIGRLIGLELRQGRQQEQRLNRVSLRSGRWLSADQSGDKAIEVLVSQAFAQARGLKPGDKLSALINGRQRELVMVGAALSPEYVFAGLQGMPDMRGFGVFWLDREQLAAAYDMRGAFNRVAIKLAPVASQPALIAQLNTRLAAYGAADAHGRADQPSHAMLDNEIKEQHVMGSVLPAIFLGVAAFLLNVVLSRLVATQREQVAALKALGYPNLDIAGHYLRLVLLITALGLLLGLVLGDWLGGQLTGLYAEFFQFPRFEHRLAPGLVLIAAGTSLLTAVLATVNAIAAIVRLAPAEAMRPAAPGRYRRSALERLATWLGGGQAPLSLRMILRNMERRPWRSGLSIGGVAAAVAIVVMGNFFRDAIDYIVDTQFNLAMRSDVLMWLSEAASDSAGLDLQRLPGVLTVESGRDVAVRFVNGHLSERASIQGYAAIPQLRRIIDVDGHEALPGQFGLVITDRLADKLGLAVGDRVRVEVLEGDRRSLVLPLERTVREMMGLNAYAERRALNRWLGEGDVSNLFALALEGGSEASLLSASKALPKVAGAFSKASLLRNMQEVSARNVRIMSSILTFFACVIAVGVVYNNARIALAERTWELASLRVLGFSRAEVSGLLLGELGLSIAVALPLGMGLGWALTHSVVGLLKSDQFLFPVVILPRTYALAGLVVVTAGVLSALVVRRHIDRLDMVAALKTRE